MESSYEFTESDISISTKDPSEEMPSDELNKMDEEQIGGPTTTEANDDKSSSEAVKFRSDSGVNVELLRVNVQNPSGDEIDSVSNESGVSSELNGVVGGELHLQSHGIHDDSEIRTASRSSVVEAMDMTVLIAQKEATIAKLQNELISANQELEAKDRKCIKIQETVDKEIHELTESLFKEAYKMATDAHEKRALAEKLLKEANGKIDVLQSEVDALKILVLNATPSQPKKTSFSSPFGTPNRSHDNSPRKSLTEQLSAAAGMSSTASAGVGGGTRSKFFSFHRRNGSDQGSSIILPSTSAKPQPDPCPMCGLTAEELNKIGARAEIDPIFHREFTQWREKQDLTDKDQPFMARIYSEDIVPCLTFTHQKLSEDLLTSIEQNSLTLENLNEEKPHARQCALSDVPRFCPFRLKTSPEADWVYISQFARNRIAAVCELLTYLRYLADGLIRCGLHDAYGEVARLRRNIAIARLGLGFKQWKE